MKPISLLVGAWLCLFVSGCSGGEDEAPREGSEEREEDEESGDVLMYKGNLERTGEYSAKGPKELNELVLRLKTGGPVSFPPPYLRAWSTLGVVITTFAQWISKQVKKSGRPKKGYGLVLPPPY